MGTIIDYLLAELFFIFVPKQTRLSDIQNPQQQLRLWESSITAHATATAVMGKFNNRTRNRNRGYEKVQ